MKIFIICPVRGLSKNKKNEILDYVFSLEERGNVVHLPFRNTNQVDEYGKGYFICRENRTAITESDEIHIFYDNKSQGVHFDIGMCFALNKKIILVDCSTKPEDITKKCFPNMLNYWQEFEN